MTQLVLIGADCEAFGHPDPDCTEPAPGTVQSTSASSISVNGTEIASIDTADMHFDSHGHSTNENGCTDFQTHDIDPDSDKDSTSLTLNGSPLYLVGDSVTTDPGSGGDVDIINSGGNTTVTETP